MNWSRTSLAAVWSLTAAIAVSGQAGDPGSLPRGTPESQGVPSAAILSFLEAADAMDTLNSFMLVRHGQVIAEGWWAPYDAFSPHELYSLSKSFTATAVGLAAAEGRLSVDDEVLKFFPEEAPENPGGTLKAMRIRDLLCMSTGHQDEPPTGPDRVSAKSFLQQPVPHKPGTHFKYNTAATFMQSAIVQKVTGETVLDYLRPRLLEPLGITGATWSTNFQGISLGGYGLKVRTEDIARFGQLYLQQGVWNGRPLVPAAWIAEASSKQTSNGSNPRSDWDQGYGYQFWRCRHGAYRGDGAFGQYCIVLPAQDAVVAITSGVKDMQAVMDLVWDRLLPAFHPEPLPPAPAVQRQLRETLAGLSVRTPEGDATSRLASEILGKSYAFPANDEKLESLRVEPASGSGGLVLVAQMDGVETRIPCGHRAWVRSRGPFGRGLMGAYRDEPLAASAAWTSEDTLVVKVCAYETPFYATHRLRFQGDQVTREFEINVGFGANRHPSLTGRRE